MRTSSRGTLIRNLTFRPGTVTPWAIRSGIVTWILTALDPLP